MSTPNFHLIVWLLGLCLGCSRGSEQKLPPKNDAIKTTPLAPQPTTDQPEPSPPELPPPVYQDSDGSVSLSPLSAKLLGEGLDLNEWDQIVGFKNREQIVLWQIKLSAPGTYQVEVDTICTGPTQEARMRVYVGDNRFGENLIQLSDNNQATATTSLGEITLDAPETYRVKVEMVGLPLIGKFAISEVRLVPLGENPSTLPRFKIDDGLQMGN